MLLKITITDLAVATKSGVKNGKSWEVREMHGLIDLNGERRRIVLPLQRGANPFAAGEYTVDLGAQLRVGRFGNLELDDRLNLTMVRGVKAA